MDSFTRFASAGSSAVQFHLRRYSLQYAAALAVALVLILGNHFLFSPPAGFPSGDIIVVAANASAPEIAREFGVARVVRYPVLLRFALRVAGKGGSVQSGAYRFARPINLFAVAYRLSTGDFGLPLVRITFIEGVTVNSMAVQVAAAFPEISAADFLAAAEPYEGYLFPDTYLFPPSATAASILAALRKNFDAKTAPLSAAINASGHSISDIVTMASLVEKEARTSTDRRLVAGILWNRIKLGMRLQVDADPETYDAAGLPPAPIANPGLDSLEAAIMPATTKYLYYLTGDDGLMHYATTYAGHQANLRKYLP